MGPDKHRLHNDERAGVDHILTAQKRLHQRDDQRTGVAVDGVHLLYHIQLQRAAQQRRKGQQHRMHGRRNDHGIHQPSADVRCILDLERVQDHTGAHEVHHEHREYFAVAGLQQPCLDHNVAHEQDQEQLRDLLGQKNADLHCFSSFPSCVVKAQKESRLSARQLSLFDFICRSSAAPHAVPDRRSPHWAGTRRTCAE